MGKSWSILTPNIFAIMYKNINILLTCPTSDIIETEYGESVNKTPIYSIGQINTAAVACTLEYIFTLPVLMSKGANIIREKTYVITLIRKNVCEDSYC